MSDDGGSCFKWLAGCGCFLLLIALCGGLVFTFFGTVAGGVVSGTFDDMRAGPEKQKQRTELVNWDYVDQTIESPLKARDVEQFNAMMETWKDSEAVKKLDELSKKDGSVDTFSQFISRLSEIWSAISSLTTLGAEYVEAIEKHGGMEKHYDRLIRIGGVAAALNTLKSDKKLLEKIAAGQKQDKNGDSQPSKGLPNLDNIDSLIEEHIGDIRKKYRKKAENIDRKKSPFAELLNENKFGAYAVANVPLQSFTTWRNLPKKQQTRALESLGWSLAMESIVFGDLSTNSSMGKNIPGMESLKKLKEGKGL